MTSDQSGYHPWTTYIWAREEARRRGDRRVGTDHLLLGLLHDAAIPSVLGVSLESARHTLDLLDQQALESLGLVASLEAPPIAMRPVPARPTLRAVLHERLPMTPSAKQALESAGRPMRKGRHISPEDVLVCLLELKAPDPAAELMAALDIDVVATRRHLAGS